ncbi:MAG TPA: glycosyltransferase family 2 protein [Gaiellaceae bacterium]|jgi:GT2 family glycosyltransferase|nr:glycosyltransferase family 2 protein [Gaiellaceae bacterium]
MAQPDQPDVSVVVVTWNAMPWLEQCLDSVRGHDVVVVDHGSTDGTLEFVRANHPEVRVVEQENKGMGGGNNTGMRVANGRYYLLLNSDAWVVDDGLDRLVAYADDHPEAAVVGPRLLNTDGTLQRSVRAEPTLWRLATEYLFIRKLAPRSRLLNPLYAGGFAHDEEREVDWLYGPALLVRRDAVDAVGLFDEEFFMFSEEVDWMTRFRRAGWTVLFYPGAEVVHVGGASHGGRMYVENLRGHLRFMAKHHGRRAAERTRLLLLWSLRLRALVLRREAYREGVRFLSSGKVDTLLR